MYLAKRILEICRIDTQAELEKIGGIEKMIGVITSTIILAFAAFVWIFGFKKVLMYTAKVYREVTVAWLAFTGRTPKGEAERRVVTGKGKSGEQFAMHSDTD